MSVAKFPAAHVSHVPVIGQPVTITDLSLPVSATLTCRCAADNLPQRSEASAPITCETCGKTYRAFVNPANGTLQITVTPPEPLPS